MKKIVFAILTTLWNREWLLNLLSNKKEHELLNFRKQGYLYDVGWINSIETASVVDIAGKPLPWLTYPFIHFIADRLNKTLDIFEFGCGNSTLYYADKVASVNSVEHDKLWHDKIKTMVRANVNLFYCDLVPGGDYCNYALKTNKAYDLIIIDGRDRVNCCINSIAALKPGGVLVLDNSEREKYEAGINFLISKGFKKIDFWGMTPTINYLMRTSLFYRDGNCLGV